MDRVCAFFFVFCIVWVLKHRPIAWYTKQRLNQLLYRYYLESIGGTYIISVVQSMERQFQIPSTWSGTMISAQDFGMSSNSTSPWFSGYVPTVIILSYLGSRGNRARWIGGGCIAVSIAHMTIASPHFLFSEKVVSFFLNYLVNDKNSKIISVFFFQTIFNEIVYDQLFAGKHTDLMLPWKTRTKLLLEVCFISLLPVLP